MVAGTVLLVLTLVTAVAIGSVRIPPGQVIGAIGRGITGASSGSFDVIIWNIRLPRALLAAAVGASLSVAGVTYQGIFRNPLAEPYLLGVASGASLGAAVAIVLGGVSAWIGAIGLPALSFAGALLAVTLVILLARRGNQIPVLSLILAGVVVGSTFTAGTSFLMLLSPERTAGVLSWLLGSFGMAGWQSVAIVVPVLLLATTVAMLSARLLNILQLGDEAARQLGVSVERVRLALIVVATLATAAAVSAAGIIGFVGLIAPHAVRLAIGPDHRTLVPVALLLGAMLMVLADLLARTVIAPAEIPVGVVTALVGGPFFLWLLRTQRSFA